MSASSCEVVEVSVVTPVYNRREAVGRAVNSLLAQDFRRSFEIVVVDDGSNDGSAEVVSGIDPRVRVVCQKNQGAAAARLRGIQEARGQCLAFLDSDDVAEPFYLSSLWDALHRRDDIVLAFGRLADENGCGRTIERLPQSEGGIVTDPLVQLLRLGCFTPAMNLMTYRHVALAAASGRQRFKAANDYDFAIGAALFGPFAFVNRFTIRCQLFANGISHSRGPYQAGYAVLAAHDGVRRSGRRDPAVRAALRERLEPLWPSAFVQLCRVRELRLAMEVAFAGLRAASPVKSMRYLWWSLNSPPTNGVTAGG